jgi:hypothetical protein
MKSRASLSLVAAIALGSAAYAQVEGSVPSQSGAKRPAAESDGVRSRDVSGQMLIGAKVRMPGGEDLGQVSAVVGDQRGYARYAIVSHGGIMGFGVKRTALPWAVVESVLHDGKLIMDPSQLESAPVLSDDDTTPTISNGSWSREADGYWAAKKSLSRTHERVR